MVSEASNNVKLGPLMLAEKERLMIVCRADRLAS
jgi:hypothetical protein